ncbi:hypothetical protein T06_7604 [Trichinella sp. T6]|nr:hypothetical protein T06_7604 [Trichinella sp. T6]
MRRQSETLFLSSLLAGHSTGRDDQKQNHPWSLIINILPSALLVYTSAAAYPTTTFTMRSLGVVLVLLFIHFNISDSQIEAHSLNLACNPVSNEICSIIDHSYCDAYAGKCRCLPNFFQMDNQCYPELNSPCTTPGKPCQGLAGSICELKSSRCACAQGYRQVGLKRCLKFSSSSSRLLINHTGHLLVENYHRRQTDNLAKHPTLGNAWDSNTVKAMFNRWLQRNAKRAREQSKLGSNCSADNPCYVKHSHCNERSVCECDYGYKKEGEKCVPGLGNTCFLRGKACYNVVHSVCNEKRICVCRAGYVMKNDTCTTELSEMTIPAVDSVGQSGDVYSLGFFPSTSVTPVNLVLCKNTCPIENAMCLKGFCQCMPGYVASQDKCVSLLKFSSKCRNDAHCQDPNGQCVNSYCACKPGFILIIDRCLPTAGKRCSLTLPCGVPYSYCGVDHFCHCYDGYVRKKDECVEPEMENESVQRFLIARV